MEEGSARPPTRRILILTLVLVAGLIVWMAIDEREAAPKEGDGSSAGGSGSTPATAEASSAGEKGDSGPTREAEPDERVKRLPDGRVEYLDAVEKSRQLHQSADAEAAMLLMDGILNSYRFAFGENPVGENAEITDQLLGKNSRKIVFIAADSPALRGGTLVDRWGNAYFFHAESGTVMKVRSAGPDGQMWTDDDVVSE